MKTKTFDIFVASQSVKFSKRDKAEFDAFVAANNEQPGELTVSFGRGSKSHRQLRFFHGPLVRAFSEAMGETNLEYIKFLLKEMFLTETDGSEKRWIKSLRDLSSAEMSEFIEKCLAFMVEVGGGLDDEATKELERVRKGGDE